ncbi:Enamine deaminase RidA, house cleaning of reactive enamine intermediates, YjgF/YER057c/UK114 family [Andreprevotia lacus DSM 23236]|uniref:Enamine deaminase RidA, house cleaning of reactive enamine intermediates, YjgF/YER057c/UK114 family n=1 Tax=Andreprevotia lacus DSM 23236 TaxID=1121001 RepID=A0A1W1XH22_9NEIS|nr:RidA family protein [Andreprevotia lacus]SMC23074.1 Enamine deaminase RidA, house cleaning of reactive enamine intermediates, YjgF/YER057c/UK114 family [Andreprevotia lacus DSM 23236]
MSNADIHRHNPTPLWSDAVVFNRIACFVEVPESGTSFVEQTRALLAQAERTLAAVGSDKGRIMMATIYLPDLSNRAEFNEVWGEWLPEGAAPARACVRAELASPDLLVEIAFTAATRG